MHDFRYDQFQDVPRPVSIAGEVHTIPSVSPYTIRLGEVPLKETPSSISLTIGGVAGTEVAAQPGVGEFWPDYSTGADNDETWNTGTILFNASDAGKTVVVAYKGMGTLVDTRALPRIRDVFTAGGSWLCPAGVHEIDIYLCGGGGGGASRSTLGIVVNGTAGGTSSFGTNIVVATGGTAGAIIAKRSPGNYSINGSFTALPAFIVMGRPGYWLYNSTLKNATGYGNGGATTASTTIYAEGGVVGQVGLPGVLAASNVAEYVFGAPGGGRVLALRVPVVPGTIYPIVIGAGGAAVTAGGGSGQGVAITSGTGSGGICIIMY